MECCEERRIEMVLAAAELPLIGRGAVERE
jgi:hypothetical protein